MGNSRDTVKRNKHYHCLEYDHQQPGDLYLIACGMERCDPGVRYGPDVRDGFHLHMVLSGRGTLRAGGREFHPRFGQFFVLKDGETAEYTADAADPWEYCWVTCGGPEARRLTEEIGFTKGVYCLDAETEPRAFYELVARMYGCPGMDAVSALRRRGILLECLALAMEAVQSRAARRPKRPEYPSKVYVERAVQFIRYNYATIQVQDIVKYIGFTRSYFTTLFKRETGQSPREYLLQYRLKRARDLLADTDLPVQEIAAQVGYENQMTFSRMFHNACGTSPTEYRKQFRKEDEEKGGGR